MQRMFSASQQQLLLCIAALLLLLVSASSSSPATREEEDEEPWNIQCPDLAADRVCAVAWPGFDYTDGCNRVTCFGSGRPSTTSLRQCPGPLTARQWAACDRLARRVLPRRGHFNCPNVDAAGVCKRRGAGFAFRDGCNLIMCQSFGDYATTYVECPLGDAEGPFCRGVAADIARAEAAARRQCPRLHYSRVCAEFLPSFSYHDGCRQVTCMSTGLAQVQDDQPECPAAEAGIEAATAYCADAEQRMLEKKSRSSFRTTCLDAVSVCRASTNALFLYDGCNRCFCMDGGAACTRAGCPAKFLTPEEFVQHCKRVGAGVVSQK